MRLFDFVYDLFLHLYVLASLPKIMRRWGKYKHNFRKRLGKDFPHIDKKGQELVWIHAVSLGETKAVIPLIKRLKALETPPLVLLSSTTETGHAEGLKSGADFVVFLPFDFSYCIRPIVKRVAPTLVILTETDFWHNFQQAAKQVGSKIVLINGKISEKSCRRLCRLPFLARRLLGPIDHFYLQGELYRTRFEQLHVPAPKLTVTGNIKLDAEIERIDIEAFKQELGLENQPVLTLGSTHDPEERIWLKALKQLWIMFPELKVMIVPRHPERFDEVAKLIASEGISFSRWSEKKTLHKDPVLLVDAMGVLKTCYQISDVAFVGGSFTPKVGGHNILEPAFFGKPALFGPYMHSQPDLLELMKAYQAGLQITPETLLPSLHTLLSHPSQLAQLGTNGLNLTTACRGSLKITLDSLLSLLQKQAPC